MRKQTQNKKKINGLLIARIIIFVVEILGAILVAFLTAYWDEVTLSKGVAILSANISILFLTSQLMDMLISVEADNTESEHFNTLLEKSNTIIDDVKIEEIYKRIYEIKNEEQRNIYLNSVGGFLKNMDSWISGMRSGALSRHDYYAALTEAGDTIIQDKNNYKSKQNYNGEIWAITFWQDDELDRTDDEEDAWIKKMEYIDSLGIPTRRLCIMKNKLELLKRNDLGEDVIKYLEKIHYYCKKDPVCKNTTVYAISSTASLTAEHKGWINKGFFAIRLSNGYLRLIRGVSLDDPDATTLGGEIDFDENRVEKIRDLWESLIIQSGAQTLNSFLSNNVSQTIKEKMIEMGFDLP